MNIERRIIEAMDKDPAEPSSRVHRTKGGRNIAFIEKVFGNGDDHTNLTDFLSDLLHASGGTIDLDTAVRLAKEHYHEEGIDDSVEEDEDEVGGYYDEPMNKKRREMGGLLFEYLKKMYDEYEENDVVNLTDFLCDILHASGGTINIESAANMAKEHYEAEGIED